MILDARQYVKDKIEELKIRADKLETKPKLVILRVGNDYASGKYVANKIKKCEEVGIESEVIQFEEHVTQDVVKHKIKSLNLNTWVTGILLQLPLPKHLNEEELTAAITPEKDVDGFTKENIGKLILGQEGNVACTPRGIISLLKHYNITLEGKDVLIINRSNIVGKPLTQLFLNENSTVTIAHSKTKNIKEKIKLADIVVTAIGKAGMFKYNNFSEGTSIVDVSINFDENGRMCGDVDKSHYDL
ncbi:MAG: bifunctional 5,10-methylenetetrahydrofolate dehydrogenase/5,10-methenyltetrahydrofolate cyclohydrolase, partial [Sarcina sp.]